MKMKVVLPLLAAALCFTTKGFSQTIVSYHQSGLPFLAVGYEFERWAPEIRVNTDVFTSNFSAELVVPYKFLRREDYYLDAGVGVRAGDNYDGIVVPIGLSVFPFDKKQFGFHTEVALLTNMGSSLSPILRGSWGITFRFRER